MSTSELINDFITHLNDTGKSLSTIVAYKKDITQLSEFNPSKPLEKFSNEDIRKWLEYSRTSDDLTPKTISRKLNSTRTFFKYLTRENLIDLNPALDIPHPKFKPEKPRILSRMEYLALKEVSRSNLRLYTMVELLLQTGLRISELSRLKTKDVNMRRDFSYLVVKRFSGTMERRIPLNSKATKALRDYLHNNRKSLFLFATKTGKGIEVRNIRSSIDRAITKAQLKNVCVNDLRNTFIVHQLSNGFSVARLSQMVGHKNLITTQKYIELLDHEYSEKIPSDQPYEL
jgi:integrase/recombinase XerC